MGSVLASGDLETGDDDVEPCQSVRMTPRETRCVVFEAIRSLGALLHGLDSCVHADLQYTARGQEQWFVPGTRVRAIVVP